MNKYSDWQKDDLSKLIIALVIFTIGSLMTIYSYLYLEKNIRNIIGGIGISIIGGGVVFLLTQMAPLLIRRKSIRNIYRISPDRDFVIQSYKNEILKCENGDTIKIIGISLQSILSIPAIERIMIKKIKEGVSFRILIMNPESGYLIYRYKEYEYRKHLHSEIIQFMDFYENIQKELDDKQRDRIKLENYDFAPRFFLLAAKDRLFFQFYIYGFGEFCGPCFELGRNADEISKMMEDSFDYLWDHPKK